MTRAELHNITGFHAPSLIAAETHLRAHFKAPIVNTDPTALIRNEGWMTGYLKALEDLRAAAVPRPEPTDKKIFQPYSAPQGNPAENPNKP